MSLPDNPTLKDVLRSLIPIQREVVYHLIGKAAAARLREEMKDVDQAKNSSGAVVHGVCPDADLHRNRHGSDPRRSMNLATGEPDAPKPEPKPQFHPVLGYIPQEEKNG